MKGGDLGDWVLLATDMVAAVEFVSSTAEVEPSDGPQLAKFAVLARSHGHMSAIILLIKAGQIVEARIITRSLLENFFLAVALAENNSASFLDLENDRRASRLKRVKLMTENGNSFSPTQIAQAQAYLKRIAKGRFMNPGSVVNRTSIRNTYIIYAQLSGDSAHPSLDALDRHIIRNGKGHLTELSVAPVTERDESRDTVFWACMALLGILVSVQDLPGATQAGPHISAISERYLRLIECFPAETA